MTNLKDENKKQNDIIKEDTENFLDKQRELLENITLIIPDATNKIISTINEYQKTKNDSLEKSLDTANTYQQKNINTIRSISNNYVELQKNILITYQAVLSKFIDKSYWNKFIYPQRYTDVYNNTNQNITNNTISATRRINDCVFGYTETVNKCMEIAQKYYNDLFKNLTTTNY
ncbi:MAG TPA: hypothetical protein VFP25_06915 [Nitrososphaeraceae archaeon]|nr:hypothetical protein [Nitrososphaeraceae archaeon]